jgi:hypothetical protein
MKTKKSKWSKVKGKWVNLEDISKAAGNPRPIKCSEFSQTYSYARTNKKSNYIPDHLHKK